MHDQIAHLSAFTPLPAHLPSEATTGLSTPIFTAPAVDPAALDLDTPDELAMRDLLLGVLHRSLSTASSFATAKSLLQSVVKRGRDLGAQGVKEEKWVVPFALFELAVTECKEGELAEKEVRLQGGGAKESKKVWEARIKRAEKLLEEVFLVVEYDLKSEFRSLSLTSAAPALISPLCLPLHPPLFLYPILLFSLCRSSRVARHHAPRRDSSQVEEARPLNDAEAAPSASPSRVDRVVITSVSGHRSSGLASLFVSCSANVKTNRVRIATRKGWARKGKLSEKRKTSYRGLRTNTVTRRMRLTLQTTKKLDVSPRSAPSLAALLQAGTGRWNLAAGVELGAAARTGEVAPSLELGM